MALSVADCLARVRERDDDAARSLVEHLRPLVIKIVRANLPRRGSEDDLTQEIFLKMFTKLNQYSGGVPLEHWVSRIAVNHCMNAIRAQKLRPEWRMADLSPEEAGVLEAVATPTSEAPQPGQAMAARELVDKLLESLAPEDRLVIRLLEMEEKSVAEVKSLTGWSAVAIRVRAFRARRKLNSRFAQLRKEGNL